jgi:hypothetical protein
VFSSLERVSGASGLFWTIIWRAIAIESLPKLAAFLCRLESARAVESVAIVGIGKPSV